MESIFQKMPEELLPWYQRDHRQLPWRADRDPYHIWISEIMLQQTRVEAVKGYYARFLQVLPDIKTLAQAEDDLLHKLWEGLGYYSRVRNLKKAAQVICRDYGGVFPGEYSKILALPGIGPYTAGAIGSIAFGLPTPAVDGNVLRLVARLTDDDTPVDTDSYKKQVMSALAEVYPEQAGDFTQAIMELGATLCGPNRKPECGQCPCREFCLGRLSGRADKLPVRLPKRQRRQEDMTLFIIRWDDRYLLEKRPNTGLLADLWQFPNVQGHLDTMDSVAQMEEMGVKVKEILRQVEKKHIFTHVQWNMRGVYVEASEGPAGTWLTAEQIRENAALPTAFRQFFEDMI